MVEQLPAQRQFRARDIDADGTRCTRRVLRAPRRQRLTGLPLHPLAQSDDQAGLLGDRDEFGRGDRAENRVIPAHQGFGRNHLSRGQFDDGLVDEVQLGGADGAAQAGFNHDVPGQLLVHGLVEDNRAGAARVLGLVHGDIGVAHHLLCARLALMAGDDSNARAGVHFAAENDIGGGQRVEQPFGDPGGVSRRL